MTFKPAPVLVMNDGHQVVGPIPYDYEIVNAPDVKIINGCDEFMDFGTDYRPGMKSHLKTKQPRRINTWKKKYKQRKKR